MSASQFAKDTTVSPTRSQEQIRSLLELHGASGFMIGQIGGDGMIQFQIEGLPIQLRVITPPLEIKNARGAKLTAAVQKARQARVIRQRWRITRLIIQAKLEAIALETTSAQHEFLADVVTLSGATIGEMLVPKLALAVESGTLPQMLSS